MPVQPQFYQIRLPMGHQGAHHNRVIPADQTAMGALAGALDKGVGAYMQSRQQKIQNENQQRQLDQQEWRDSLTNAINQAKMEETVRANKASEQYRTDSMQATADYRNKTLEASEKARAAAQAQAADAEISKIAYEAFVAEFRVSGDREEAIKQSDAAVKNYLDLRKSRKQAEKQAERDRVPSHDAPLQGPPLPPNYGIQAPPAVTTPTPPAAAATPTPAAPVRHPLISRPPNAGAPKGGIMQRIREANGQPEPVNPGATWDVGGVTYVQKEDGKWYPKK